MKSGLNTMKTLRRNTAADVLMFGKGRFIVCFRLGFLLEACAALLKGVPLSWVSLVTGWYSVWAVDLVALSSRTIRAHRFGGQSGGLDDFLGQQRTSKPYIPQTLLSRFQRPSTIYEVA